MKQRKGMLSVILGVAAWAIILAGISYITTMDPEKVTSGTAAMVIAASGVFPFCVGTVGAGFGIWAIGKKQGSRLVAIIGTVIALAAVLYAGFMLVACITVSASGGSLEELVKRMIESGQQAIDARHP